MLPKPPVPRVGRLSGVAVFLVAAGWGATSCSLTRTTARCESIDDCHAAFGPGHTCSPAGLCEQATIEPACHNNFPEDLLLSPEKYKDWVLIGSLLRTTGKEGARHDAAVLAVEFVNDFLSDAEHTYPTLEGLRFGLIQCDSDGNTEEVARLARYLTGTLRVPLLLGPASSARVDAAFREINLSAEGQELRQALFVTPSATSAALTRLESETPGLLWRTTPTDDGQGRLMGAYANEQNMPLAVFYEQTGYGEGLYAALEQAAPDVCDDCGISFAANSPNEAPLVRAMASNEGVEALDGASTVVFIGAQETHIREMIDRVEDAELSDKMIFFSDAAATGETFQTLPTGSADRIMGTRVSPPPHSEPLRLFTNFYEAKYEESPLIHSFTAHSYDAAWLLLLGGIWSYLQEGEVHPALAAQGLRQISSDSFKALDEDECPLPLSEGKCPELSLDTSDLGAMIESFQDGRSIDVRGASGDLDYCSTDEELERSLSDFELWRLDPTEDASSPYRIVRAENQPSLIAERLPRCPAADEPASSDPAAGDAAAGSSESGL